MNNNNRAERKFYFLRDLEKLTGYSRITLRRMWEAEKLPRPRKINGGKLIWPVVIIEEWFSANGC